MLATLKFKLILIYYLEIEGDNRVSPPESDLLTCVRQPEPTFALEWTTRADLLCRTIRTGFPSCQTTRANLLTCVGQLELDLHHARQPEPTFLTAEDLCAGPPLSQPYRLFPQSCQASISAGSHTILSNFCISVKRHTSQIIYSIFMRLFLIYVSYNAYIRIIHVIL